MVVDTGADGDAPLRNRKDLSKRIDDGERIGIECRSVDDRAVVDRCGIRRDEEGCFRAERPFQAAPVFVKKERRFLRRVGISRIPEAVSEIVIKAPMKFLCARLGQYLDSAVTKGVVFG